ncbi:hypothetical protein FQR65_LT20424 [Abscondita terminalis]|nr:hypothetical protein FQR65_LT20424 [Abscondita terminalis]
MDDNAPIQFAKNLKANTLLYTAPHDNVTLAERSRNDQRPGEPNKHLTSSPIPTVTTALPAHHAVSTCTRCHDQFTSKQTCTGLKSGHPRMPVPHGPEPGDGGFVVRKKGAARDWLFHLSRPAGADHFESFAGRQMPFSLSKKQACSAGNQYRLTRNSMNLARLQNCCRKKSPVLKRTFVSPEAAFVSFTQTGDKNAEKRFHGIAQPILAFLHRRSMLGECKQCYLRIHSK